MKQNLTIEQLRKAREIGATHISPNNECWVYKEISGRPFLFRLNGHVPGWEECFFAGENPFSRLLSEIDFSPLDEPERMTGGYRDVDKISHETSHHKRSDGSDLIDDWWSEYSTEQARVLMWEQVRKYKNRLGKKDPIHIEVAKMADYMARWAEKEKLIAESEAE